MSDDRDYYHIWRREQMKLNGWTIVKAVKYSIGITQFPVLAVLPSMVY